MRVIAITLGMTLLCLAAPGSVGAQVVKPNILIVFDTSGSMVRNAANTWTYCDGQYPPVGNSSMGRDSRIYNLKEAVRQALYEIGVDEANFGLGRFAQLDDPNGLDACPFPSYQAGYYIFPNNGCNLSTHTSQTTFGAWFNSGASQAIVVPVTDPAQGLNPPGSSAFDPVDANLPAVFRWLDHRTLVSGGAITDPEIQAIPNQLTPIGRSIFYARMYFDNYVIPKDDPDVLPCRTNIVIMVTDGGEACDTSMTPMPSEPTQPSHCDGGSEFNPRRQACLLYRPWDPDPWRRIRTYVLTMPGLESSNNPIALAGGTGSALIADFTNQAAVKAALMSIIAEAVPSGEVCNGLDDNCNGLIDEGVKNACPTYPEWCAVELCNGIDDNCDGQIDEGLPLNACGGPCGVPVPEEIPCNGIDDDCDPSTPDEPEGCTCGVEYCNGLDDDCDGLIDDDDPDMPNNVVPCGPSPALGICQQGTLRCNWGDPICEGAVYPRAEECNGLDDNCNGIVDDVVYPDPHCLIPDCTTECCDGRWACVNGVDTCVPSAISAQEVCDGIDNDCDGRIDEGAICGGGLVCWYGTCVFRVPPDGCGAGYVSVDGLCVEEPCLGSLCPGGMVCEPDSGQCVDPCEDFDCGGIPGTVCDATLATCDAEGGCTVDEGACVSPDCLLDPTLCEPDEVCRDGECVTDPCFGASALDCEDRACRDGACVDTCVAVTCEAGSTCVDGTCEAKPCGEFSCPPGQSCVTGQCAQNPCGGVTCRLGEVCKDGVCVDEPCRLIVCPPGALCDEGQCVGQGTDGGVVLPDAGPGVDAATEMDAAVVWDDGRVPEDFRLTVGGGGCTCQARGPGGATGGLCLLFGVLLVGWIRRRR